MAKHRVSRQATFLLLMRPKCIPTQLILKPGPEPGLWHLAHEEDAEAVARLQFTAALGLLFGVALFDAAEEGRTCCTRLTRRFWCFATFAPNDLRHYEGSR